MWKRRKIFPWCCFKEWFWVFKKERSHDLPPKYNELWDLTSQSTRKPNLFSQVTKSVGNHDDPWKSRFPAWYSIDWTWAGGFRVGVHPGYGKSWEDPRRENSQCWSCGFGRDKGWKGNKRQRGRKELTAPIWDQFLPYPHPKPVRECFAISFPGFRILY